MKLLTSVELMAEYSKFPFSSYHLLVCCTSLWNRVQSHALFSFSHLLMGFIFGFQPYLANNTNHVTSNEVAFLRNTIDQ